MGSGIPNKWFVSHLSNRKHFVLLNGYKSILADIQSGVSQGSILGPLSSPDYIALEIID